MMKELRRFLFTVAVALVCLSASAYDFFEDGFYFNVLSEEGLTCEITHVSYECKSYSGDVVVPATVSYNGKNYTIVAIGDGAFCGCDELTSVVIPNTVTRLGCCSFDGCSGLKQINIPLSVETIDQCCLRGCVSLPVEYGIRYADTYAIEAVDRSVLSYTLKDGTRFIGEMAFQSCQNMTSIIVPCTMEQIAEQAFYDCFSLTSISLPEGLISVGSNAFGECTSLVNVDLPSTLRVIGGCAFTNCCSLETLAIPANVDSIGAWAFSGCSNIRSMSIPATTTKVGENPFMYCNSLSNIDVEAGGHFYFTDGCFCSNDGVLISALNRQSLKIPNTIKTIGKYAIANSKDLTELEIPNSVTFIDDYGISYCEKLISIVIPASVVKAGTCAFDGCYNVRSATLGCLPSLLRYTSFPYLEEITLAENLPNFLSFRFFDCQYLRKLTSLSAEPPVLTKAQFSETQYQTIEVLVPDESLEKYELADVWKEFVNIKGFNGNLLEICATPTVQVMEGRLLFESATSNSTVHYSITSDDIHSGNIGSNFAVPLSGQYNISFYATADGFHKSETVSAVLIWVSPSIYDPSGMISMEAKKAVVIRLNGYGIVVSGTERGEKIELYTVGGVLLNSMSANDGETTIPCHLPKGEVVIVKYGNKAVKVKL